MNLLTAIISDSKEISSIILDMSTAVKCGNLDEFQKKADFVISKIERKNFIEIPENEWENILADVRKKHPEFQSNFVLEESQIDELLEINIVPETLRKMLLLAKKDKKRILQILQDNEN